MGYRLVIFANTALRVAVKAAQDAMRLLREEGTTRSLLGRMITSDERQRLVGLPQYEDLDRRFAASAPGDSVPPNGAGDAARR
jgi:2-methylisocitrate lyase-like PEP mutase family enzyme